MASKSRIVALIGLAAVMFLTAGCTAAGDGVPEPIIVDVNEIDGTTVEVPLGTALVISGDEQTYTDWTATIADESILTFTPGKDEGEASFRPGFETEKVGETDVTMENSSSDDTVEFTVSVTPAGSY